MDASVIEEAALCGTDLYDPEGPAAPIAWYGGKYLLAPWIISLMPPHEVYIEPYGGMANVLLQRVPAPVEVYNDLDSRLVNFFRVIRDPAKLAKLQRLCELTPNSREEFARICQGPEPEDDVERAYRFFVLARMARGGLAGRITPTAFATSTRPRRNMPEPISKYLSALDGLGVVADRFRRVVIEHMPAVELIKKYDKPGVLFYLDPPYVGSSRFGGKAESYAVEMTDAEHEELLGVIDG